MILFLVTVKSLIPVRGVLRADKGGKRENIRDQGPTADLLSRLVKASQRSHCGASVHKNSERKTITAAVYLWLFFFLTFYQNIKILRGPFMAISGLNHFILVLYLQELTRFALAGNATRTRAAMCLQNRSASANVNLARGAIHNN